MWLVDERIDGTGERIALLLCRADEQRRLMKDEDIAFALKFSVCTVRRWLRGKMTVEGLVTDHGRGYWAPTARLHRAFGVARRPIQRVRQMFARWPHEGEQRCPACGFERLEGARFCGTCGLKANEEGQKM